MRNVRCISVRNPLSFLICIGVKTIENRTFPIEPGELYIHSSGKPISDFAIDDFAPKKFIEELYLYDKLVDKKINKNQYLNRSDDRLREKVRRFDEFMKLAWEYEEKQKEMYFFKSQAIVGKVTIQKVIKNSHDIWAEKNCYHWVLTDPILFNLPILYVLGKQKIFYHQIDDDESYGQIII